MDRRELLLTLPVLGVAAATAATATASEKELTLVVMDPLSAQLSCPCVAGYAQRDYEKLAAFLTAKLGRPVKAHFAESLAGALQKKTEGKADVIIGKDSMVRADAKAAKMGLQHLAALTGKDGLTVQKGLIVVAKDDPALAADGLKGYTILFGQATADEKHAAALALLKDLGVPVPKAPETCVSCSVGATKVLDLHKKGEKAAAVISSYAQPLLEGCGTIKKGDLRVIGETDPVPFIAAFANDQLSAADRETIKTALLEVGKSKDLCTALETKDGFVLDQVTEAKKK
jgi:ABC-type phosphate/phosphonate transport system substrate-binding protein